MTTKTINAESVLIANKRVWCRSKGRENKVCVMMSQHNNAGGNSNANITNKSFLIKAKIKYLQLHVRKIYEKMKSLNLGNPCYHSQIG